MPYVEIPSDEEVVAVLQELGGRATAAALCDALVGRKHPRRESQLAIQRAAERRYITVASDWMLSVPEKVLAA